MMERMAAHDNKATHLSDEDFTSFALGDVPRPVAAAHLAACEACSAQLARFQSSIEDFGAFTREWSETQPAPSLRRRAEEPPASVRPYIWIPAAAALAAAMLVLTVEAPHARHARPVAAEMPVAAQDSAAQIAADNQLMQSVDMALATPDDAALAGVLAPQEAASGAHAGVKEYAR